MSGASITVRLIRSAVLAGLGLQAADAALAQTAADPGAQKGGLDEVVVTARKRLESAQDVPVSLVAISGERIDRYDLTSLERLSASTPQLTVGRASNGSGAQITLRGIGSQATSIGLEQSTAIIVDGVYYGQGRVINEAFFDLERVELLKGPQSLFFGKNATAGAINIVTADPGDEFEAMMRAGYEFEAEQVIGEGFVSGPISENVSARLAVRVSNMYGGYMRNEAVPTPMTTFDLGTGALTTRAQDPSKGEFPGTNEKVVRGTLKWQASERLSATFKANYIITKDEANAWNYVPYVCAKPDGTAQTNPNVRCKKDFVIRQPAHVEGYGGGVPGTREAPFNTYKSAGLTATFNYELDTLNISSVNNYNWNNNEWGLGFNIESPVSFTASHEDTSYRAFSSENRVQTTFDGPLNLLLGAYYQKTKREYYQNGAFVTLTDSSAPPPHEFETYTKDSESKGETISVFGQAVWNITSDVELAAGVRYTDETKDSYLRHPYIISPFRFLFLQYDPNDPATSVEGDQKFTNWSPEVTLTYKPTDDITIYGAYKTAYKSGGFSNSAFVIAGAPDSNIAFSPEKAKGFEGGIKTTLLDRQLRFNLSAFRYKYTNLQVDFFDSITFAFITTNAGSAITKGIEAEFQFMPRSLAGFEMHGALNYNKARYREYIAPCYGGQSIAAGCDTTFLGGFGQDLSGKPPAVAPKWTATLGMNYETEMSDSLKLGFSVDGRYSSSYLGSSFGEPLSKQNDYISLDASIRLRTMDDRWEFAVIGRNLTDNFHITGILDAPNSGTGTGTSTAVPADILGFADFPRTVRVQLTHRFR